jgi:hypothetical protein
MGFIPCVMISRDMALVHSPLREWATEKPGGPPGRPAIQMNGKRGVTVACLREGLVQTIKRDEDGRLERTVARASRSFGVQKRTAIGSGRTWNEMDSRVARQLKSILSSSGREAL